MSKRRQSGTGRFRRFNLDLSRTMAMAVLIGLLAIAITTAQAQQNRASVVRVVATARPQSGLPDEEGLVSWTPRTTDRTQNFTWTDNRCGSCHVRDPLLSHPIDIIPSMHVPDYLPLDNGRMTCVTCHEDSAEAHKIGRKSRDSLLRQPAAGGAHIGSFCVQCHDPSQNTRKAQHGATLGRAHLDWSDLSANPGSAADGFDPQTQTCLSCHDGAMSSDIAISARRRRLGEHPVGVFFTRQRSAQGRMIDLRSAEVLDSRIRLIDNKVGCLSCHSLFSDEPKLLVMSNERSRLCFSCHQR